MTNPVSEELDKKRLEIFIDAILAIIMTILVLEFKVPESAFTTNGDIKSYLYHLMPSIFAYLISFITIVSLWMDHHNLFSLLKKVDTRLIFLNFLFILFLSAIPFTTSLAGKNNQSSYAVTLVGLNYLLMALSFNSIYRYVVGKKMIPESAIMAMSSKREKIIIFSGNLLLILSIPLAFINTFISFSFFIIVIVLHLNRHWHH
jgi:uncharacterized membrane protein